MDDRDVLKVVRYIENCIPSPNIKESKECFKSHSYSRWAANEILERMIDEAMKLPPHISGEESLSATDVIDYFIMEMEYYSDITSNRDMKKMFDVAGEEGRHILTYIK